MRVFPKGRLSLAGRGRHPKVRQLKFKSRILDFYRRTRGLNNFIVGPK